jgi:glycosyltransferase involved in cell wall biosynthesis
MYFPEFARGDLEPFQQEVNEALIREARHAAVRLSVSRWQQEYLLTEHGIATDYLPNGVDVAACERGRAARFCRRYGIRGPFILYVGRNDPVKNPADFVRLAGVLPSHTLVMLGQDLDAEVLRYEWEVAVPDNLIVLGKASPNEVQDALAASAALVVTSKREGLPTLVLEAMVHGKPVVVPAEAGCVEAVGTCGFIYQPGDITDLAAQTLAALGDTDKSGKGRQRVLEEYDWRVVAKRLDDIYRGMN